MPKNYGVCTPRLAESTLLGMILYEFDTYRQ